MNYFTNQSATSCERLLSTYMCRLTESIVKGESKFLYLTLKKLQSLTSKGLILIYLLPSLKRQLDSSSSSIRKITTPLRSSMLIILLKSVLVLELRKYLRQGYFLKLINKQKRQHMFLIPMPKRMSFWSGYKFKSFWLNATPNPKMRVPNMEKAKKGTTLFFYVFCCAFVPSKIPMNFSNISE